MEPQPRLSAARLTLPRVVTFDYASTCYSLTEREATRLAENLRNYARGTFPTDVERAARLSGNPAWTDGALPVADCIEDVLVERFSGPVPLEGKAAEATYWTLRLTQGLGGSVEPTDVAAMRDALATQFAVRAAASS
jgi:hypothetical protein